MGIYQEHKSYKAKSGQMNKIAARKERQFILDALFQSGRCAPLPRRIKTILIEDHGGDALDSVIACLAAASALHQLDMPISSADRIEGKVYFEL